MSKSLKCLAKPKPFIYPIPINDVWIVSGAVETSSLLITYDNHFRQVPGIRLWDWEYTGPEIFPQKIVYQCISL
jgi:predicted nucleic acid-binding protein